jgi:hypothetical protein
VIDVSFARRSIVILCASFLTGALQGCAASYEVVQLPQRQADLYPLSQTKNGITIAIDEIKGQARAERYFGADLIKAGILPVMVVVSNYSEQPVLMRPSDILLHRGREILDPLPIDTVLSVAKSQHWFLRSRTEEQIDDFFESLVFTETALSAEDTYQGVLFFSLPRVSKRRDTTFIMSTLFREGGPKVRVGVTQPQTGERLYFGPFTLSLPEETRAY